MTQGQIQQLIEDDLVALFDSYEVPSPPAVGSAHYAVRKGSATIHVTLSTFDDQWLVYLTCVTNRDMRLTPELLEYIATDTYPFGSLKALRTQDGFGDIAMTHTLLGEFLAESELMMTLAYFGNAADTRDDEIAKLFGT